MMNCLLCDPQTCSSDCAGYCGGGATCDQGNCQNCVNSSCAATVCRRVTSAPEYAVAALRRATSEKCQGFSETSWQTRSARCASGSTRLAGDAIRSARCSAWAPLAPEL